MVINMKMKFKSKSKRTGFTLVEILTVVALIAILFTVMVPKVYYANNKAREVGVETDFKAYATAFQEISRLHSGLVPVYGDDNKVSKEKTARDIENKINTYLDRILQITIDEDSFYVIDEGAAYGFCGNTSRMKDPWGVEYKIYGAVTPSGPNSWIQVVSCGVDKVVGSDESHKAKRAVTVKTMNDSSFDVPATTGEARDNYSLTVFYNADTINIITTGFDRDVVSTT